MAISQAGAYINENMLSIDEYLKLYNTNKWELLKASSLPPGEKHEPIYVSWEMNIKDIKKQPYGEQALSLLDIIS